MKTIPIKHIEKVFFNRETNEFEKHVLPFLKVLTQAGVILKATDTTPKFLLKRIEIEGIKIPSKYSKAIKYTLKENFNTDTISVDIIIEHDKKQTYDKIFQNFCKERHILS